MKRMRLSMILLLALTLLCSIFVLSSCFADVHTHTFSDTWKSDETRHWHECTTVGCGEIAEAVEHSFGEWTVTLEPTCQTEGSKSRTCSVCEYKGVEALSVVSNAHLWNNENTCTTCQSYKGVHFTFDDSSSTYIVTGYTGSETEIILPSVYKGYPVTGIGASAFYDCYRLTSVVIPDSVTSIGEYAFSYCDSLTSVVIGDSVTSIGSSAFSSCHSSLYTEYEYGKYVRSGDNPYAVLISLTDTNMSTYTIHKDTKIIASGVFSGCSLLTSITIPDSVTSISDGAFSGCDSLTSVVIPDSVTSIGDGAFSGCDSLTSVVIPDSVTSIGDEAFSGCSRLTSIHVDSANTVYKSIDGNLYSYDGKIFLQYSIGKTDTSFTIPDSVTSIGDGAFYYCRSLTSVVIPDSVTSIGSSAFYGCDSLTAVYITDIAKWCEIAFVDFNSNPLRYANNLYLNGEFVTKLVIPEGVTSIGNYAFCWCSSLTSVVIPNSVTSIGNWAFAYCSSLTSIKYRGTSSQWDAISKGRSWNSKTGSYTITYNYTEE